MMDLSKLNPIEWIKDLIQAIYKLPMGVLISSFILLTLLIIIPQKYIVEFYLPDFMPWLSVIDLFVIILIIGRIVQKIIDFIKYKITIKNELETLSGEERSFFEKAVKDNTTSIYIDSICNDIKALISKGLISKPEGGGHYGYTCIISSKAWPSIKKFFT